MTEVKKCPVCDGKGCIRKEGNWAYRGYNGEKSPQVTCHGCDGKGWVKI